MRRWAKAPSRSYFGVWVVLVVGLLFYLFVFAYHSFSLLGFPFDFDQGEGYDVNSAWALSQGWPIYSSPDQYPFYSSNYPPLYSLLLAPVVGAFGPEIALGRLLSLLAVGATMLVIALAVHGETGRWRPALVGALFFSASPYVFHVTPLARVNALMVALALAGLYAVGRASGSGGCGRRAWLVVGGGLLLAALFAKQMAFDALAAAVVYIYLRDARRGLGFGAAVLVSGGLLYLAIDLATGGGFSLNILWANANPFLWDHAIAYFSNFIEIHPLLLLVAVVVSVGDLRRLGPRGLSLYSLYFGAGLVVALGTGKWGAGESYFLPGIAAACVLLGRGLAWIEEMLARVNRRETPARAVGWAPAAAILLLGGLQLQLLWHGPWSWPELGLYDRGEQAGVLGKQPTAADVAAGERISDRLRGAPGEVLAEESGFALVAGRRVLGNATQQRNLWEAGKHDPAALVLALERGDVSVVVLNAQQYPPPVLTAIGQHYYAVDRVQMNGFHYLVLLSGRRKW